VTKRGAANTLFELRKLDGKRSRFDNAPLILFLISSNSEELKDTVALSMVVFNTGNIFYDKGANCEKALN